MTHKTKQWTFQAFQYDPYGLKPDWWHEMVKAGSAAEFYPRKESDRPYAAFGDKRSKHKVFVGDWIVRDEFGRTDVYSARNFISRGEKL